MPNLTEAFVQYLFDKAAEITPALLERARACREDTLACTLAGAAKNRARWEPLLKTLHLGKADSVLGGVLGAARGVLIVLLIAYALRLALPALGEKVTRDDIDKTIVFKYAYSLVDGE